MIRAKQRRYTAAQFRTRNALRFVRRNIQQSLTQFIGQRTDRDTREAIRQQITGAVADLVEPAYVITGSRVEGDRLFLDFQTTIDPIPFLIIHPDAD